MINKITKTLVIVLILAITIVSCKKDIVYENNNKPTSKEALIVELSQYSQTFNVKGYSKAPSWWKDFKKACGDVIVVAGADVTAAAATAAATAGTIIMTTGPGALTPAGIGVTATVGVLSGAGASIYTGRHMKSSNLQVNEYVFEIEPLLSNSENKLDYMGKNHNYLLDFYTKSSQPEISKELLSLMLDEYLRINKIDENTLFFNREDILKLAYNGIMKNIAIPYQSNNITNFINNNYQDSFDREIMNIYFTKISTIESVDEFIEYTKGYEHIIISKNLQEESFNYILTSLSIARFSVGYWVSAGGVK